MKENYLSQIMKFLKKQIFPTKKNFFLAQFVGDDFSKKLRNSSPKNRKKLIDLYLLLYLILYVVMHCIAIQSISITQYY